MPERKATISRETKETAIRVEIAIDGSGKANLMTGIRMFDHMLDQLARHGAFDLQVSATGSDQHHVVEDVAICLGKAFNRALGDKAGLTRMADATVPMDDALAMVALDISGRGWCTLEAPFAAKNLGDLPADLIAHFFQSFAAEARVNIHARVLAGENDHHRAEALFKAFARALDAATRIDPRLEGRIPSTKEVIEG